MQRFLHLLREVIARLGVVRATLASAMISVIFSLAVVATISLATAGYVGWHETIITLAVSLPVSVIFSYVMLRLVALIEVLRLEIEQVANHDMLTGLDNRRSFQHSAELVWPSRGSARSCGLIVLDIDNFKAINDRFGHPAGDSVIRNVGLRCRAAVRRDDIVARYGGEEFAILLPGASGAELLAIAEHLRVIIASEPIACGDVLVSCTASFGVADSRVGDGSLDTALVSADRALYAAKRGGRNRVATTPGL